MCTHNISFLIKMKIILQLFDFSTGLKNVETVLVNEPSVLEPLKFYCNYLMYRLYYIQFIFQMF